MAFPTGRNVDSAERIAEGIDVQLTVALNRLVGFRNNLQNNSQIDSLDMYETYQAIVSAANFVENKKNTEGLDLAYARRFPSLENFDPSAEWSACLTAIVAWANFILANWPERSANGALAFVSPDVNTKELKKAILPITGTTRTNLLTLTNNVLNAFT